MLSQDERLAQHDIQLAIHTQQIGALMDAHKEVVGTMNKLIWTVLGGSISVTITLLGAIVALLAS